MVDAAWVNRISSLKSLKKNTAYKKVGKCATSRDVVSASL